jgi:hypothetical protein
MPVPIRKIVELMVDNDRDYEGAMITLEESNASKLEKETVSSWIVGRMLLKEKDN